MLAPRNSAAVAGNAIARPSGSVIEARAQKGGGIEMAGFARRVRDNVCIRFWRRQDAPAECVAAIAIPRRTLEHPAHVAGFASCRGMSSGKREASGHVVEVASAQLRLGRSLQRNYR